jgi:hypothetical protein
MAKKLLTAKAMRRIKEGGVEFMAGCGGEGRNIGSPAQRRMRRSLRQRMAMVSKPIETYRNRWARVCRQAGVRMLF